MILPFYTAPGKDDAQRRILLISYHFPPSSAAGALRWQKFSPFLYERGWGLDVVAADPAQVDTPDWERMSELPPGTRVWGVPYERIALERIAQAFKSAVRAVRAPRPRPDQSDALGGEQSPAPHSVSASLPKEEIRWDLHRASSAKRAYTAFLQTRRDLAWARGAYLAGGQILDLGVHAAVISCGPPHMAHEAARMLSVARGLPMLMDLRDPWSLPRRLPSAFASPLWFSLARHYERKSVQRASVLIANTDAVTDRLAQLYSAESTEFITVTNGADEHYLPPSQRSERFVIAYAGGVYLDRNPRMFLRAVAGVIRELRLSPGQFGVEFIGHANAFDKRPLTEIAHEEGVANFVRIGEAVPRAEALAFLSRAQLLLSLPQDSPWSIPSKIFEYMGFHAWILALADENSPVERLLRGTEADVVSSEDLVGMQRAIRTRYLQYYRGEIAAPIAQEARFSRRFQAAVLIAALDRATFCRDR